MLNYLDAFVIWHYCLLVWKSINARKKINKYEIKQIYDILNQNNELKS